MRPELHLFIIWSNARSKEAQILADIASRFKILGVHPVAWNKKRFSANLTRFYGENLPPHSNKEKLCGNGTFILVVVLDEAPLYRVRMTSKGPKTVNVNLFDSKEMYRYWTGGGHMVHATNTCVEAKHDLVLLTGYAKEDYINRAMEAGTILTEAYGAMPGEVTWESMGQVLYVLNQTVDYVVLRNFTGLFEGCENTAHKDVDILTSNQYFTQLSLNAKPVYKSKRRVQHVVSVADEKVYFDIRYVGDNYYCTSWEKDILAKRFQTEDGYYKTDSENYAYSLLYHALVHKKEIANDYTEEFASLFPGQNKEQLTTTLMDYLYKHDYQMNEPYDYSVYFNEAVTGRKMSAVKFANKAWHKVFRGLRV